MNPKISKIRVAVRSEAKLLSRLAFRSKAYWGYSQKYLRHYREVLKVPERLINSGDVYVIEKRSKIAGFFAFNNTKSGLYLDFLFVDPDFIGEGLGLILWECAISIARQRDWPEFRIVSDPHALGFYLKMGAEIVGTTASEAMPKLKLPLLIYFVDRISRRRQKSA